MAFKYRDGSEKRLPLVEVCYHALLEAARAYCSSSPEMKATAEARFRAAAACVVEVEMRKPANAASSRKPRGGKQAAIEAEFSKPSRLAERDRAAAIAAKLGVKSAYVRKVRNKARLSDG